MGIAGLARLERILLSAKLLRQIVRIVNSKLLHHLLLLCRTRFPGRQGDLEYRRGLWGNGSPFVEFLTKVIGFIGKQDVGAFNLAKIEALSCDLVGCGHQGICVWSYEISELLRGRDDIFQGIFFLRLER